MANSRGKIRIFEVSNDDIMKQFTITIPDDKVNRFLELMKRISFISKIEVTSSIDVPFEQQETVNERIEKYGDDIKNYKEWDDIEKNIKHD